MLEAAIEPLNDPTMFHPSLTAMVSSFLSSPSCEMVPSEENFTQYPFPFRRVP